ncbi:MAG: ethanolamine ammonia-lyase subunit EutC [Oscillospiraceae bacterium]|nr:ethanolamine ammonia-lyase subunit EutC [Oscillospiraceae bacterium]
MANQKEIENLVAKIVSEIVNKTEAEEKCECKCCCDEQIPDITAVRHQDDFHVPDAVNEPEYMRMKARTPARIGVWRAGTRLKTDTFLRFRADHAVAVDAVFTEVPEEFIKDMGMPSFRSQCHSKAEYLQRPDLGRLFDEETAAKIKSECKNKPTVQIIVSDGLSSTAVTANIETILPAIMQGLKVYGLEAGTPFFVRYARVGIMDQVTELLNADVTVNLIGERPGLATGESMSAYITYKGYVGMPEAGRTVISNIHKGGTPPVEAGAHIAELAKKMLDQKISGLGLQI